MSNMKYECKMILRFLTVIVAVPVLGAGFLFLGCDGVVVPLEMDNGLVDGDGGSDSDGDADSDSDADGDTDTDTDTEIPCMTGGSFGVEVVVYGVCQTTEEFCDGGYFPQNGQGTCPYGLWCCIGTDQCESQPVTEDCVQTICEPYTGDYTCTNAGHDSFGVVIGCPDNQVCCFNSSECDWN